MLVVNNNSLEGFESGENEMENLMKSVQLLLKKYTDILCPTLEEVRNAIMEEKKGAAAEQEALAFMKTDSTTLFQSTPFSSMKLLECPLVSDPLELPPQIDKIFRKAILYCSLKLKTVLKKIEDGLACKETFTNTCTPEQEALRSKLKAEQDAMKCTSRSEMSVDDKKQLLTARLNELQTLENDTQIQTALQEIQTIREKIADIKRKTESGELKPNCQG